MSSFLPLPFLPPLPPSAATTLSERDVWVRCAGARLPRRMVVLDTFGDARNANGDPVRKLAEAPMSRTATRGRAAVDAREHTAGASILPAAIMYARTTVGCARRVRRGVRTSVRAPMASPMASRHQDPIPLEAPQPQKSPGDVIGDNLSFCEYGSKKAIFSASKKEPARARAPHDARRRVSPTARVIALTATCLTPLDSLDMLDRA